jgi:DNA polymerase-3 subunit epsilon
VAGPHRSPATLLIVDTETTALDPTQGRCLEVGAILFAVAERAVLSQVSFLLPVAANPAEPINGIPAAVTRLPQPWQAGLRCFSAMLEAAEAVLAHNAAFDRQWFGIDPLPPVHKPWICSMEDIRWPADLRLKASPSVRDLALAHGVPVWAAHRALTDCIYLAQVLERRPDLEELLSAAMVPRYLFRALVSYAERHKPRDAGFRWNQPVAGAWSRRLTEAEAEALSFPVQRLEAESREPCQPAGLSAAAAA